MGEDTAPTLDALYEELVNLAPPVSTTEAPTYLFRGERCPYPTTFSYLDRYYHTSDFDIYSELENVTARAMAEVFPSGQVPPRLRGAYAQHYGLPTQIFDFTASPQVATFFACNQRHHRPETTGSIGVLDVRSALASGLCEIFDIRGFRDAPRAARQNAFGLIFKGFRIDDTIDLKNEEIAKSMGLRWRPFRHLDDDRSLLQRIGIDDRILSTDDDSFAALAQEIVDDFVATRGPLTKEVAAILARDVPAVGRSRDENARRWQGGA
jgi:hypothetical protein